jgi:hypothetical protein
MQSRRPRRELLFSCGKRSFLTTIRAKGSILVDPLFKEISGIFPDVTRIDRTSTHAWSHPSRIAGNGTGPFHDRTKNEMQRLLATKRELFFILRKIG